MLRKEFDTPFAPHIYAEDERDETGSAWGWLKIVFYFTMADGGDSEGMKPLYKLTFFVFLVVVVLIMMNLYIAIIGEAYNQVMAKQASASNYLLAELILEIEIYV